MYLWPLLLCCMVSLHGVECFCLDKDDLGCAGPRTDRTRGLLSLTRSFGPLFVLRGLFGLCCVSGSGNDDLSGLHMPEDGLHAGPAQPDKVCWPVLWG
jgi:hypothetical protein